MRSFAQNNIGVKAPVVCANYFKKYEVSAMPVGSNRPQNRPDISGDEYRRYQEEKAKKRQKLRMRRLLMLVVFVLAAVLLVVCIVMIFRGLFKSKTPASSVGSSVSTSMASSVPTAGGAIAQNPDAWNLQIISPAHPADASLAVPELTTLAYGGVGYYIDTRVADTLQQMITDCNAATGGSLKIISGYRSYAYSEKQYNYYLGNYRKQGMAEEQALAAAAAMEVPPGTNEHQTALAVDFVTNVVTTAATGFDQTAEYQWLRENGANYGFIMRYQADKTELTGVAYQPYHFRFVGVEEAKEMRAKNLCLEEYVGKTPGAATATPPPAASNAGSNSAASAA
ncbi:M15 family metallopeptidase [Ruminococcaceae bacterium OttesenSCG-928-A16]|nr:M15 family metallopeptidase [Ruminococcaceae bacterium OttesenSCG-928-A16]